MDGKGYKSLLIHHCIPELKAINPENPGSLAGIIWIQDVARVHRLFENNAYLDSKFGSNQFALGSKMASEWPARSPDCNPLDYCLGLSEG